MPTSKTPAATPPVADEPGMAERFQRGLQRAFQMPHKPHRAEDTPEVFERMFPEPPIGAPKAKTRPAGKGRVHKGKTGR
jgi:hypothetical protein